MTFYRFGQEPFAAGNRRGKRARKDLQRYLKENGLQTVCRPANNRANLKAAKQWIGYHDKIRL